MSPRDVFHTVPVRSAAAAYRTDLTAHGGEFGPHDGAWIAVGSLLEHAALLPEPDRSRLLIDAIEFSREIVGEESLGRLGDREWQDRDRTPIEAVMLLADSIHRAGALNTAGAMLDGLLLADSSMSEVHRGRILSQRARVLRKMSLIDEAYEYDREVARIGRRVKSVELRVRASLGYSSRCQMRGNYPELYRHSMRAARLAEREGLHKLARDANSGLLVALGVARRFDEGLIVGWRVYQASIGDRVDEGETLQNIGQLLFESGHLVEARAGFAAVVSRQLPVHIILAALGGLAITSAETGQPEAVEWAAAEAERLSKSNAPQYCIALAHLESAIALHRIGRHTECERHRLEAIRLGQAHGFHEIAIRAEKLETGPSIDTAATMPLTLTQEAATVANRVAWLEPERLPEHVVLEVTPA